MDTDDTKSPDKPLNNESTAVPPQQLQTPNMPQPKTSSSRAQLRAEIGIRETCISKWEAEIASRLERVESLWKQRDSYTSKGGPLDNNTWEFLHWQQLSEDIVYEENIIAMLNARINVDNGHLAMLRATLEKADQEAEQRAQASCYSGSSQTELCTEGPDAAYIPDNDKFKLMLDWLNAEKALLLRSPPGSGKTSFAISFAMYLDKVGFRAMYLNAALSENTVTQTRSMEEVWQASFQTTFSVMCRTCPVDNPIYVIMDEAQTWYPANVVDGVARQQVIGFWADVKYLIMSKSMAPCGVRLLCLAGYGEANVGTIMTPVAFKDPQHPVTAERLPLGLDFLRLDSVRTAALVKKYLEIQELEGKKTSFGPEICELIYNQTNGHVGVIRTLLFYLVSTNKKPEQHIREFVKSDTNRSDLNAFRTFLSVSATTIHRISPKELALLVRCILSFKQGHRTFSAPQTEAAELIKLGIFVKTSAAFLGEVKIAFPSPLHFDLALFNILNRNVELKQTRDCFEEVLKEMVLRMSPSLMRATTPAPLAPLERRWQDTCRDAFRSMAPTTPLKIDVGREFDQRAYLDMYIDGGLQWGIELIRCGGGKRLEDHVARFSETDGRYRCIPMKEHAVLHFTDEIPTQATLDAYDENVWHLVYNATFTKVTVYRNWYSGEEWDLIGDQTRDM